MMHKLKLTVAGLVLAFGFATVFATAMAAPVAAQAGAAGPSKQAVCEGINVTGGNCSDNGAGLSNVIKSIITIISAVAGFAAVIMIIIGGLRYVTSGGDASKTASAKSTIIYAIVGLVIVALAQFIVRFVAGRATTAS